MCGIFGWINRSDEVEFDDGKMAAGIIRQSERRGKDAGGIAWENSGKTRVWKVQHSWKQELKTGNWEKKNGEIINSKWAVGQTRLMTNGDNGIENIQPIITKNITLVHNGIVVNDYDLARDYGIKYNNKNDTTILTQILEKELQKNHNIVQVWQKLSAKIMGTVNTIFKYRDELAVLSNNGSLFWTELPNQIIMASEKRILEKSLTGKVVIINQIKPGRGMLFNLKNFSKTVFEFDGWQTKLKSLAPVRVDNTIGEHQIDFDKIKKIKRCARCILPETTPGILFDEKGVCNFCTNYQKIEVRGEKALEKLVKKYRSTDGSPDCIIAFSGGRDSSYGLHYLVKKLKMHPVAVTFDWGMLSDIGRKNQALMLGKLGVQHVIVAANMKTAREDIKKNLEAWLCNPDLGMVPILMQGDKTTEYYIDQIKKEMGVKLVFFCRGNSLEREEFKAGYAGVRNADPGGVIHHYPVADKIRLLVYYARKMAVNPLYWNRALLKAFWGYVVTYVMPHEYIYLWHYIPWDEEKIIGILRKEYGWLADEEVGITWRIDDGSPAFYNYLYGQIQGFTENDSFRSNQIREGMLTREEALKTVNRENRPRYQALQWYFETIGMDGDRVLSKIDQVKKRY